jgi:hypothetical protein
MSQYHCLILFRGAQNQANLYDPEDFSIFDSVDKAGPMHILLHSKVFDSRCWVA